MILAAGIFSVLILAFCLCVRRHELVYYYRVSGDESSAERLCMEPPDGFHYQITCVWRTLFRWKLSHSCYSMYTVNPPRHFNCRSQVEPILEPGTLVQRTRQIIQEAIARGDKEIDLGHAMVETHYPGGVCTLYQEGVGTEIIIDHEKEMEE